MAKSPGEVSMELQSYLLRRILSPPRDSGSPEKNWLASYLTIKLGRLGLYTVSQKFSYFNNFTAKEESGQFCPTHLTVTNSLSRFEYPGSPAWREVGAG